MRFSAWFSIGVGLMMLGQWLFFLATGSVPELRTEPVRIALHLAAEAMTALALVASGFGLLRAAPWAPFLAALAHGMLAYTIVVSPGYFAERGEWPPVAMFGVLALLTAASAWRLARAGRS